MNEHYYGYIRLIDDTKDTTNRLGETLEICNPHFCKNAMSKLQKEDAFEIVGLGLLKIKDVHLQEAIAGQDKYTEWSFICEILDDYRKLPAHVNRRSRRSHRRERRRANKHRIEDLKQERYPFKV